MTCSIGNGGQTDCSDEFARADIEFDQLCVVQVDEGSVGDFHTATQRQINQLCTIFCQCLHGTICDQFATEQRHGAQIGTKVGEFHDDIISDIEKIAEVKLSQHRSDVGKLQQ